MDPICVPFGLALGLVLLLLLKYVDEDPAEGTSYRKENILYSYTVIAIHIVHNLFKKYTLMCY